MHMPTSVLHTHSTAPRIMSAAISARKSSASSAENTLPSSPGCTPRVNASANAHMKTPQEEPSCCCGSDPDRVPVPSGFRRHGLRLGAIGCLSAHSSTKYCCKIVRTSVANRGLSACPSLATPAPLLFESKYISVALLTAALFTLVKRATVGGVSEIPRGTKPGHS